MCRVAAAAEKRSGEFELTAAVADEKPAVGADMAAAAAAAVWWSAAARCGEWSGAQQRR
jgi:hypothetical protein